MTTEHQRVAEKIKTEYEKIKREAVLPIDSSKVTWVLIDDWYEAVPGSFETTTLGYTFLMVKRKSEGAICADPDIHRMAGPISAVRSVSFSVAPRQVPSSTQDAWERFRKTARDAGRRRTIDPSEIEYRRGTIDPSQHRGD